MLSTVVDRVRFLSGVWWRRSWKGTVALAASVAIAILIYPTLLLGSDTGLGVSSLGIGLQWGLFTGGLVGSTCVLGVGATEYDGGLRAVRHTSGTRLAGQSCIQLAVAGLHGLGACLLVVFFTSAGALVDAVGRAVGGGDGELQALTDGASWWSLGSAAATSFMLVVLTWLLLTGMRSSRACAIFLAGALGTWVAALVATRTFDHREFLAVHPLAAPWHVLGPTSTPSLTLDAPGWLLGGAAAAWMAALVGLAAAAIRRP